MKSHVDAMRSRGACCARPLGRKSISDAILLPQSHFYGADWHDCKNSLSIFCGCMTFLCTHGLPLHLLLNCFRMFRHHWDQICRVPLHRSPCHSLNCCSGALPISISFQRPSIDFWRSRSQPCVLHIVHHMNVFHKTSLRSARA